MVSRDRSEESRPSDLRHTAYRPHQEPSVLWAEAESRFDAFGLRCGDPFYHQARGIRAAGCRHKAQLLCQYPRRAWYHTNELASL